ncbi:MAG: superoxide dismutase family protein [Alphaproteobacteria bacterium]|nr:superoxide dismutase family protein [Alphaproteobacteria bacterium]
MSRPISLALAACLLGASAITPALAAGGMLMGPANAMRGNVTVTAAPKGVLVKIDATGLTPGWHAVHFHEKGDCTPDAFTNAGAHVHTMTPAVHGLLNPAGNDLGDLPNIYAAADGTAHAELFSQLVMMPQLMDADGSAVVIHAAPDDYTSQPIGGAGARVACAVIK